MRGRRFEPTFVEAAAEAPEDMVLATRQDAREQVFVSVDLESEHNFWTGLSLDISEGGLFVATHQAVQVGSMVLLYIALPPEKEPIFAAAFVRWTRPYNEIDEIPPGVGLQFLALDPKASARIRRFLSGARAPLLFEEA